MSVAEQQFIEELSESLSNCSNKQEILKEYEMHLYEIANEDNSEIPYQQLKERLGSPQEIASMWHHETAITPNRTQWLFVTFNICLFVGGSLLTWSYNVFDWTFIEVIWGRLTHIASIIIIVYFFFWALLGYEIGKEFGPKGRKLLRKTFVYCVAPNLILMALTIFQVIPYQWFQPLLSIPFIISCIVFTGLLYPVSWIGYHWGKKASI
ncbi:HAAS signaling domain-containing protein [Aquibacillus saliphilus]|uniref:HAAS signaling domain-containing protein n=1 Tax=Aquibacillus saliphilus TaxID=1909422 RepID=UPI001CF0126B|nr:DUF1700 domain-containing protein [Aquibacillus saliphilus]